MKLLLLACLVSAASAIPFIGTVQSVAVTGKLTCNGKPAENVKVKLYEKEVLLDKLLDEKFTDAKGTFNLSGSKKELTTIDPKVNIYHKCNYEGVSFHYL
ncbi:Transthyretin-like family protein [Oesophagostomum dentatum]|uniref:Transthyretin-like family protein n=1 Tax=Oesophagostomum dentatum TaxID=61180 RepID=A0A0B1TTL7_OESDE|nr:Transthyretin-like family protein [Oesophagostomum dentatum]